MGINLLFISCVQIHNPSFFLYADFVLQTCYSHTTLEIQFKLPRVNFSFSPFFSWLFPNNFCSIIAPCLSSFFKDLSGANKNNIHSYSGVLKLDFLPHLTALRQTSPKDFVFLQKSKVPYTQITIGNKQGWFWKYSLKILIKNLICFSYTVKSKNCGDGFLAITFLTWWFSFPFSLFPSARKR